MTTKKLWGGRFKQSLDDDAIRLSYSLESDKRIVQYDLLVNQAHITALHAGGWLNDNDFQTLYDCLEQLKNDFIQHPERCYGQDEDIHSCIERLVTERCGDLGKKMHTGKSRNDQVITDTRLFTKDAIQRIESELQTLISLLIDQAEVYKTVLFPGFTHFQPAQPVLLAHHWLAYAEQFHRDLTRFQHAFKATDICPLGSGALAGNNYNLDRQLIASTLKFSDISRNSMDAVSDRDFICDTLSAAALTMTHLSRFCEELIIFSSPLVGFIQIGDSFTTGSSLMPQKKNPDIAELIRGKTGRVHGHWQALQTTLKGLPLTYNRDLQEDKFYLFDTVDTVELCLKCFHKMLAEITINSDVIYAGLQKGYGVATDFADYLVSKQVPFRDAHDITGKVVLYAIGQNIQLHDIAIETLQSFCDAIEPDVYDFISYEAAVAAKTIKGGTALQSVEDQLKEFKRRLTWNKV